MTIRKTTVRILYKDNIQDRCLSIRVKNSEDDLSQKDITSCIYTVNDNTSANGETRNILSVKEILDEDDSTENRLVKLGYIINCIKQLAYCVLYHHSQL